MLSVGPSLTSSDLRKKCRFCRNRQPVIFECARRVGDVDKMVPGCTGSDGRPEREQISARRVPAVDLRPISGRVGQAGDVGGQPLRLLGQRALADPDTTTVVSRDLIIRPAPVIEI